MQGIGNYQIPTSVPRITKSDLRFIDNNSRYLQYFDDVSSLDTQLQCLNNSDPFYYREANADIRELIRTLTLHKEVMENDNYRGSLSDLEEYINFYNICHTINLTKEVGSIRTYFIFNPFSFNNDLQMQKFKKKSLSFIPIVYAGGGMGTPTYLAMVEKTYNNNPKELGFFISKKDIASETKFINQLLPNNVERYSKDMAYFTCSTIVGVSNDLVYVGCGGGDGPGSAWGLVEFNLSTMKGTEIISCITQPFDNLHGKSGILSRCMNNKGRILKEEFRNFDY